MSEPRHIYVETEDAEYLSKLDESSRALRYTSTSGEEWTALMERARYEFEFYSMEEELNYRSALLRDLLAYFGESP